MSSIEERMKVLPEISIMSNEEFVLTITHSGIKVAQVIVSIDNLTYNATTGKSSLELRTINPEQL